MARARPNALNGAMKQNDLFRPLTKYNGVIDTAARLPLMVRAPFRAMTTGTRSAAHLGLPFEAPSGIDVAHSIVVLPGRAPALRRCAEPGPRSRTLRTLNPGP